jgi:hypothetical protein
MPPHKGGKKNRKHGRNKLSCQNYRKSKRQEINKAIKVARHNKRYGEKATQTP